MIILLLILICMKKRIFVAIKVSSDINKKVKAFQKDCQKYQLNWLSDKDLHITILSPWDEEDIADAKNKLKEIKRDTKKFEIGFNHITLGPYYDRPKLVWAKGKSTKEIYQLKEKLEKVFSKYPQRRFKLHLTLARFGRDNARDIVKTWENKNIAWTQSVESIVLFESVLDDDGIGYKILSEVKL